MEAGKRNVQRWSSNRNHKRHTGRKTEPLSPGEKRRMVQLIVCLILFGFVFVGRGVTVGHLSEIGNSLGTLVRMNTDFRTAFSRVGQSVSEGDTVIETFGVLWSGVFGPGTQTEEPLEKTEKPTQKEPTSSEQAAPTQEAEQAQESLSTDPSAAPVQENPDPVPSAVPEQQLTPPSKEQGIANETPSASQEPPEKLLDNTTTPVMGVLTSGFGYRTHPLDGQWKFHNGVDLMEEEGTDILAFADGEVDYIGESPVYGLYTQLKHGNGITTFYAHCKMLCVKKGQKVKLGEKIAELGKTGNVTGPHLHFEIKKDGERIDPITYIKTKE